MADTSSEVVDTKWLALRALSRGTAPRYLAVAVVAVIAGRVVLGNFGWADLALVAVLVVTQPFIEWLIHVHVLHARPRTVLGIRVDPGAQHRVHHENPRDLTILFIPLPSLVIGQVAFAVIFVVLFRSASMVLTGLAAAMALGLYYEWMHFLAHTSYRPRIRYFRNVGRAHRLHHFKSEHYWYGITNTIADRVLRTFPDKAAVPTSPTAQNLFGDTV